MILEPKPVPTIIKVDRAFLDKHDPNRYGRPQYTAKKRNTAVFWDELRAFLKIQRETNEIATHFGINNSKVYHALRSVGAKCVRKGKPRLPGIWIYEPRST